MDKILETLTQFPANRQLALYNILGGADVVEDLLASRKTFRLEGTARKLVDKHGRFIPFGLQSSVVDADYDYYLSQPKDDYKDRFVRMAETFISESVISMANFIERTDKVIERIKNDARLSNLLKGVYLRILLPHKRFRWDSGEAMEEIFLPAVEAAYKKQFPGKSVINYLKNNLVGEVIAPADTRYYKLTAAMAQGVVPAVYFPTALQGFSNRADREIIDTLPEDIILSAGYDIAVAMVGHADVLARDYKTPALDMAAWQLEQSGNSLNLRADEGGITLGNRDLLARSEYSGGVVILG